jgi:hypothetical protein
MSKDTLMHSLIYIAGLIVVVIAILSFLGLSQGEKNDRPT